MIIPRIETCECKKLVGKRLTMTYGENRTPFLWQSFMPRLREISNRVGSELFSMQVYGASFDFNTFNPNIEFEKWAAVEVIDFENIPAGMDNYTLQGGLYAVFDYKGLSNDTKIFQYIFGIWLPASTTYALDHRPHFEVLGEKYKNNDPESEEEIWIPIKNL